MKCSKLSVICVLAGLGLMCVSSHLVAQSNAVTNGGFESPVPLRFWETQITANGATIEIDSIRSSEGKYSCRINTGFEPIGDSSYLYQDVQLAANTDYLMTLWIYTPIIDESELGGVLGAPQGIGKEEYLGNDEMNTNPATVGRNGQIVIRSGAYTDWTKLNYFFNSGDYVNHRVFLKQDVPGGGGRVLYIDDILLVDSTTTTISYPVEPGGVRFDVSPNPSNQVLQLSFDLDRSRELEVVLYHAADGREKRLFDGIAQAGHNTMSFDVSQLPPGIYVCSIVADKRQSSRKVIIAH